MRLSVPLLLQREIDDKPPTIESEDEEATALNEPSSNNNNSTNESTADEPSVNQLSADESRTIPVVAIEESIELTANLSVANNSVDATLANDSSANDTLANYSSTNNTPIDGSSTDATVVPERLMNANESRRSKEYLQREKSEVFIGKADLNLTEG